MIQSKKLYVTNSNSLVHKCINDFLVIILIKILLLKTFTSILFFPSMNNFLKRTFYFVVLVFRLPKGNHKSSQREGLPLPSISIQGKTLNYSQHFKYTHGNPTTTERKCHV